MSIDFLDNGLPLVQGQENIAREEIEKFRKYCNSLKKNASQLTEKELEEYYNK